MAKPKNQNDPLTDILRTDPATPEQGGGEPGPVDTKPLYSEGGIVSGQIPETVSRSEYGGIDLGTPEQYIERVNPVGGLVEQGKKPRKPRTSKSDVLERLEREFETATDEGVKLDLAIQAIGILNLEREKINSQLERNISARTLWRERYRESVQFDKD